MFELTTKNEELTVKMLQLPQVSCPVYHHFGEGVYIRELHIPAGTMALGHKQKYKHNNILLKGSLLIVDKDENVIKLEAPMFFVGEPGQKKGIILEDVVWQNIFATTETNIDVLEQTYFEKSDVYIENTKLNVLLNKAEQELDRKDYSLFLDEIGLTEEDIQNQMDSEPYLNTLPSPSLRVSPSSLHGVGVFTTAPILIGSTIGVAKEAGIRNNLGRFINHSAEPNCYFLEKEGSIYLIAKTNIEGCLGGSIGTELTVNYREVALLQKLIGEQV